ncbi:uncharacterized protein [Hyperolius riggenbachi]|uniref:uncharacterized protein n=1 Tax=Hyperolius riggenbachi TaxID=752182 RepID=UPI0035A278F1
MTISNAFGSFYTPGFGLFKTAAVSLFLIGIQAILDNTFQCPSSNYNAVLSGFYSLSFFLCPAIIFIFLGLIYFPGTSKGQWCPCWGSKHTFWYVSLMLIKPALIWLLIEMTDGRFLACFVYAASNYRLDRKLYLYIFQTSGMLAITALIILSYIISKLPCDFFSESKRTYQVLDDVKTILKKEKKEKQQAEDKQKFLNALQERGEFQNTKLPQYMLDARHVLNTKLQQKRRTGNPLREDGGE